MTFVEKLKFFKALEKKRANEAISRIIERGYDFDMVYLPNKLPKKEVKYFFIGMEPSFGGWKNKKEFEAKIKQGFVNFYISKEDFILHYAIHRYLSADYHITDVSKIAMFVRNADSVRSFIYPFWRKHLKEEIELFQDKERVIFSIGGTPEKELIKVFPNDNIRRILHFSPAARGARKKIPELYPDEFKYFKKSIDTEEMKETCLNILYENNMSEDLFTLIKTKGIERLTNLTESDYQLMFTYKKEFDGVITKSSVA